MSRSPSALALLLAVSSLTGFSLRAQTASSSPQSADVAQLRMNKSIERQKSAVARMAASVARQQSSVGKQQRNPRSPGFFDSPPVARLGLSASAECDSLPPGEIDTLVNTASERTSVSPALIRSVMGQESAFRPCAVSAKGAMGLMQLMPATAGVLGVKDIFDPEANVLGGARLLKQLMDRYGGDLGLTLSAYNAGSGKVDATMGVPMIPETMNYVSRILSRLSSGNSALPAVELQSPVPDDQLPRDSASDISLRLTGSADGE